MSLLNLQFPGTAASHAILPTLIDPVADIANDVRCIGIWPLIADYATLDGGSVAKFANLKTGGPALASASNRAGLVFDELTQETMLRTFKATPAE